MKRRRAVPLMILAILLATFCPSSFLAAPQGDRAGPPMVVSAWVSVAGPYGPLWDLTIGADGRATLEVLYGWDPAGSLTGNFEVSPERLAALRAAIDAEHFFDLPAQLGPTQAPLHMPDLRLDVQLGARQHKVALYDPAELAELPTTRRFLGVWEKAFAGLPVKPTW